MKYERELFKCLYPACFSFDEDDNETLTITVNKSGEVVEWHDMGEMPSEEEHSQSVNQLIIADINREAKRRIFDAVSDGRQGEDGLIRQVNYLAEAVAGLVSILTPEQQAAFADLVSKRGVGMAIKQASDQMTADPQSYQGVDDPRWP